MDTHTRQRIDWIDVVKGIAVANDDVAVIGVKNLIFRRGRHPAAVLL